MIERSLFPYAIIMQVSDRRHRAADHHPGQRPQLALVICATIIAIFPIISNTTVGCAASTGPPELFAVNRASRLQNLIYLRIRARYHSLAGLRVSSGWL